MASQMSDLSSYRPGEFKRKYEKELHLMIDDLEMPNDDMTISSLSQSPWQGKSTRSFLSNLTSARGPNGTNTNTDEIALTAGSGMISRQDLQNFNGSVGSSQEFEYGSAEGRNNAKTFKSYDEGKGSPAFARELISVTDDLTVSNTDEENKSSYRGTGVGLINIHDQSKSHTDREYATLGDDGQNRLGVLRNQNRTFADSVIDHQASQMAVSIGAKHQSAFKDPAQEFALPERRDARRNTSPFDILERNEENEMDPSEMSELDYLA